MQADSLGMFAIALHYTIPLRVFSDAGNVFAFELCIHHESNVMQRLHLFVEYAWDITDYLVYLIYSLECPKHSGLIDG